MGAIDSVWILMDLPNMLAESIMSIFFTLLLVVLMEEELRNHIERVKNALSDCSDERYIVERVTESTVSLLSKPLALPPEKLKIPDEGYGRNLLYQDPDHGFVVMAMVWPPEGGTPIHDHGTWGVVGVNQGTLEVTNYSREDEGNVPGRAMLNTLGTISAGEGAAAFVFPPDEEIHKVWNATTERAVSIHTYGEAINNYNIFNLDKGTMGNLEVSYT